MKDRYDANRESLDLQPGDLVLISTKVHPKLRPYTKQQEKWAGPYVIHKRVNENAYALVGLPVGMSPTQSASFLTPFRESPEKFQSRPQFEVAIPRTPRRRMGVGNRPHNRFEIGPPWQLQIFGVLGRTPHTSVAPPSLANERQSNLQDYYQQRPEPGGTPLEVQEFLRQEPTLTEQLLDTSDPDTD